jgi:hypothetical protein
MTNFDSRPKPSQRTTDYLMPEKKPEQMPADIQSPKNQNPQSKLINPFQVFNLLDYFVHFSSPFSLL